MQILSIETSCDETSCSVVAGGDKSVLEIATVTASSSDLHQRFGGVVPEVAARKQLEYIVPVISDCLGRSKVSIDELDAIAVTVGPGLVGSLLVGVEAAKALALAWQKPLIAVNHLVGHIYANFTNSSSAQIRQVSPSFPSVALVVSGGHTDLVLMRDHYDFTYLGGTLDDAAGEAFDKTARLLGLQKYNGGVFLANKALMCSIPMYKNALPRPMVTADNYDFSFSGLKTAVSHLIKKETPLDDQKVASIAFEFQEAVNAVLIKKTLSAAKQYYCKTILLGGGVSANTRLREKMELLAKSENINVFYPKLALCGDNAAYIGAAGYFKWLKYKDASFTPLEKASCRPSLSIVDLV